MNSVYDIHAPKKATNLSINTDLLKKAKAYGINLSKSFEAYLAELVKQKEQEMWEKENRRAIEAYNKRIKKQGCFSDDVRSF